MPCRVDESPSEIRERAEEDFTHNSRLAEIFCETMREIEEISEGLTRSGRLNFVIMERLPQKAITWWNQHKARDKKRVEAEVAAVNEKPDRKAALAKLSPYERKLLGLK